MTITLNLNDAKYSTMKNIVEYLKEVAEDDEDKEIYGRTTVRYSGSNSKTDIVVEFQPKCYWNKKTLLRKAFDDIGNIIKESEI